MLLSSLLWGKKSHDYLYPLMWPIHLLIHSLIHSTKVVFQRLCWTTWRNEVARPRFCLRFASSSAVLAFVRCSSESHQTLQLISEFSGFSVLEISATLQCASWHPQGLSGMGHRPWGFSHISTCFPFFFDSPSPPGSNSAPGPSLEGSAPLFPVYSLL